MSWKSIFGSELNLSFLELALALAGSSILMLCAVLLFFAKSQTAARSNAA